MDHFISAQFNDRIKTCTFRTWQKYNSTNVGSCNNLKTFASTKYFVQITGMRTIYWTWKKKLCLLEQISSHGGKKIRSITDRSMCRCGWTQGSEPWGCAGQPVRAGSWVPWGHFRPPGCPGSGGREEGCCLDPPGTQETEATRQTNYQWLTLTTTYYYCASKCD